MHARALLLVLGTVAARSLPAAAQPAEAQRLFDEGRRLLTAGKLAEACSAFDASERLDPRATTELNAAACHEQNGELATAWAAYQDAGRMARASGEPRLEQAAITHAQKLESRLSRLTISVPPDRRIPGLEVLRGNEPVGPASWDRALPVDGGSYTITARAPGHEPWSTTRTVKGERDAQTAVIPRLAELRSPPAVPDVAPPAPAAAGRSDTPADAPRAAEPSADRSSGPSRVAPIALGEAAVMLGVVGLGLELESESTYDDAVVEGFTPHGNSLRDSANLERYIAQGLAVAAIGCAGVGVYLIVRDRGARHPAAAVVPVAAPGLAGIALTGRW
jgi:tetratricopeptide (TPR) repeat protein